MAVRWVIECDNCQAQEPLQFTTEVELEEGGTTQQTIVPAHWITYRQNDRIKHFCGVKCVANHIDKLAIEEINERQPKIKKMQQAHDAWQTVCDKIRKAISV